jgi:ABC-type nitrate/sulfonate/bicarbonate transport system substrate-binding protein
MFRIFVRGLTLACAFWIAPIARAADTVIVGTVGSASANLWPVFIGINKGLFAEQDIKIDLVYVQSSAAVIQQLTAGSLDVTMSTGLVDPIRAIEKGAPIAIVRFESQSPPYALLARPTIKSLRELKGKVISLGGAKDITRIYVERMLAPSGIKPGEFDMVFAGATSARAAALQSGAVDAAILLPPSNFQATDSTSLASRPTLRPSCRFPAPSSACHGRTGTKPSCCGCSTPMPEQSPGSRTIAIALKPSP